MSEKKRVVITGMGAITPIGSNIAEIDNNLRKGNIGICENDRLNEENLKYKFAGLVKNFDAKEYVDFKQAKRMDRFSLFAMAAAKQAIEQSGIDVNIIDKDRCGVCIGCATGSLGTIEEESLRIEKNGFDRITTMFVPLIIPNMAAANIAINFGFKGKCTCPAVACSSGSYAISDAYTDIQNGEADLIIAGGAEACISKITLAGFAKLHTLSKNENLERAMIPFDKERAGFVMGEGAGVVVLEEYEHAVKRNAKILAEIAGSGYTCDAVHIVMPDENGSGIASAMRKAISKAGIKKEEIKYINAHGTATELNDKSETKGIKNLFGDHAYNMYINSTKSMTGHMISASGAVEIIACVLEMNGRYIHKTAGLKVLDEELGLNYMMESKDNIDIKYALSNSMGFGGHNVSILLKAVN